MSEPLHRMTLAGLSRLVSSRAVSPRELVEHFLARIEAENGRLNAFVTVCPEEALRAADGLGEELARGRSRGPLHGIPVAIKDLTDTAGLRTTYGSSLFRDHVPEADAAPVALLRAAGAVVVGKTNTHEFAFGTTTDNPHYGATHNPWRAGHVPGGSSGGSGSAVAAGLVPLATGTDTGGSIRIPAAACGCVGHKPTYGRVSLRGTLPLASSLDHVGPLARTAEDCALALTVLAGFDPRDPWSRELPHEDFAKQLERPLRGLRVGIAPRFRPLPLDAAVEDGMSKALRALEELGMEIVELELPDANEVLGVASTVLIAEAHVEHAESFAAHRDAYGSDVREQLESGRSIDVVSLVRAQHARERIAREIGERLRHDADALLLPTMAVTAPPIGAVTVNAGGVEGPVALAMAAYTLLHDATRLPAVAIPTGLAPNGLPTSVQISTADGRDALALAIGHALEQLLWPAEKRWPEGERPA